MTTSNPTPIFSRTRIAILLASVGALCLLPACQKTLLHADDARSPFDRYNQTRTQYAPPYLQDEYGRRTPNLRDRLVQSDE